MVWDGHKQNPTVVRDTKCTVCHLGWKSHAGFWFLTSNQSSICVKLGPMIGHFVTSWGEPGLTARALWFTTGDHKGTFADHAAFDLTWESFGSLKCSSVQSLGQRFRPNNKNTPGSARKGQTESCLQATTINSICGPWNKE